MKNIRKEVANRLKFEFQRRGLTLAKVSDCTNIPADVITSYINGKREIVFDEITNLCNSFGINSVRLLFNKEYPRTTLAFRNIGNEIQTISSQVEDAFLLIENSLPEIHPPKFRRSIRTGYKRHDVIQEAGALASRFRNSYPTPESFLTQFDIPVIPVGSKHANFDAFIVSKGSKTAICINIYKKPPHRIIFSLAHEICHILFDLNKEIPIDVFFPNLNWQTDISDDSLPEFFAYKFAQFYLIPYSLSIELAKNWPKLDMHACQKAVSNGRTLKEVLINALFDTLSSNPDFFDHKEKYREDRYDISGDQFNRMDFEEDRESDLFERIDQEIGKIPTPSFRQLKSMLENITPSRNASSVFDFLSESKRKLTKYVRKDIGLFSDEIIDFINGTLEIELR